MSDLFKISPSLLEAIKGVQKEENEFQAKVRAHMAKKGIKSLGELTPEEKKKFFNEIDAMHQAKNEEVDVDEACWDTHKQEGMKKKGGKMVPNCVPKNKEAVVDEATGVTDYAPKSQGGTRKELLVKYHKTKNPKDAEAARKAGATQKELQGEETELAESDGPVVWKKGEHTIEKLEDGKFAVYMGDKKGKTFSSLEDAKASISEAVGGGTAISSVKTVVAQKKRAALAQKIADTKEKHSKEMEKLRGQKSNVKEEFDDSFLDESFSPAMVAKLKAEYGKISSIDPSSDSYKKLIAMLDKMDKKDLQTLADAGIKFVSGLARNRVNRMKNEEVELDEAMVKGKGYDNPDNTRKAPEGNAPVTSLMPGHDERAAKFLARQAKGKLVKGKAQSAPQKEETELEEGSGSKEKQKTPYRDINSPETRAEAEAQRKKMAADDKAEKGKKLLDRIKKKANEEVEQVEELTSVEPKAKKEKEFVDAHTIAVKDSGDSKLPESDRIKPAQGKRNADKFDNKQKFDEETFSEKLKRIIFEKKEKENEVKNKEKTLKKGETLSGKKEPIEINPEISEK
jgi:hypothetical protein